MSDPERTRRGYKTGSVEPRGNGSYRLRVVVKDPGSGRLIRKSKTVTLPKRGYKGALEKAMRDFQEEVAKAAATGKTATVGVLIDHWLTNIDRADKAKTTMEAYRRYVEKRIRPALGHVRLDELTTHQIDLFYADLERARPGKKPLSPRSVELVHSVLRSALAQAVDWGWIGSNPALKARRTRPKPRQVAALTSQQVNDLIDATDDLALKTAIALAAVTGMRRSELVGLKWNDIDPDANTVTIQRAWVPTEDGDHLTGTKTGYHRTIPLGGFALQVLDGYERAKRDGWGELGEWILSDGNGEKPLRSRVLTDGFRALAKDLDITATFHSTRHFHDSVLIASGVDVTTASRRSGHTPKVLLEIYSHGNKESDELAGEVVGNSLVAARKSPALTPTRKKAQ